jgi:isopenicillin N synthase-like dioxygenase
MATNVLDQTIPIIDVASAVAGSPSPELVAQIAEACEAIGFFVIVNHGMDPAMIDGMHAVTRELFALDVEVKNRWCSPTGNRYRGFSRLPVYEEGAAPDLAEVFEVTSYDGPDELRAAGYDEAMIATIDPNIWPDEPAGFEAIWREYFQAVQGLAASVMQAASMALDLPADWFAQRFDRQSSYLTGNYYPAQPTPPVAGQVRRSEHTDIGALTILHQHTDIGGLEVKARDGSWVRVPVIPGSFIVNLGDMIAKWTNDRWVATPHRVVNPSRDDAANDRLTIAFFQNPNHDALIECIPTCLGPGETPKYEPVLARDWTAYRMQLLD